MVKVKICGLTNREDYELAKKLGADYTGFIFHEKSPRFINKYAAVEIIGDRKGTHCHVGVFVNEKEKKIKEIYDFVGLDIIQLHGDESTLYCQSIGLPYWKVIRVENKTCLSKMTNYTCTTFLLDTYSKNFYGGTGTVFNQEIAIEAMKSGKKIIIAGGVSIENIKKIIELKPFAVDVCSSIEEYPGKKNPKRMKKFMEKINKIRGVS